MTVEDLKSVISDPARFRQQAYEVLREIATRYAAAEDAQDEEARQEARDLVIRCLEQKEAMREVRSIHDALLIQVGLFPYIDDADDLPLADKLLFEAHRPLVEPRESFVFHETQAQVYALLMDGKNVILTAPTSFGKTLIVDALVASGNYNNVVVVVPTIALIDEVRRRLSQLNAQRGLGFTVIAHPGQRQGERNLFVFTQERLLEEEHLPDIDLGVIDEFYKLSLERDRDRATLLNLALARLRRKAKQLYLLGPSVGRVEAPPDRMGYTYIPSLDSTVAVDLVHVRKSGDERADLITVASKLDDPTLVYVRSPARAHEVARWLVEANLGAGGVPEAAEWVGDHFHPEWTLVASLKAGIGIHHGRIPRALGQYMVSAFNEERLRFLVCTQTLIEGVNTTAKNILIVDGTIMRQKLDLFTFRNIQGRAGRMFNHFVGRVYLFNDPPQTALPVIDIPLFSQPAGTPPELLLGLPDDELEPRSRDRIAPYLEQRLLNPETLRENGVDPDAQLAVARELEEDPQRWSRELAWSGFPRFEQLEAAANVMWDHFRPSRRWGARSARQLTQMTLMARGQTVQQLIANQVAFRRSQGDSVDDAVLDVLTFFRSGLTFGLPKYLRVLDRIQREVFERHGLPYGDYRQYAGMAEAAFESPLLMSLDEYGIPIELAKRLRNSLLRPDANFDDVLERLRTVDSAALGAFEAELLRGAQTGL